MDILVALLIGVLLGMSFLALMSSTVADGIMRVNTSDPDGPYLFLELNTDIHTIMRKKNVNFRVKIDNSQK